MLIMYLKNIKFVLENVKRMLENCRWHIQSRNESKKMKEKKEIKTKETNENPGKKKKKKSNKRKRKRKKSGKSRLYLLQVGRVPTTNHWREVGRASTNLVDLLGPQIEPVFSPFIISIFFNLRWVGWSTVHTSSRALYRLGKCEI